MTQAKVLKNPLWLLGWDLGEASQWAESGPGRLVISLFLGWAVSSGILGHYAVRERWPWTASTPLLIGTTLVLALALWGYWLFVRRTRKTLVPALQSGERGRFRSATPFERRLLVMMSCGMGILCSARGWPLELLMLFYLPWAVIIGAETLHAYRDFARLGFELREGALRSKLAPHFIFNTLNTLHAQIEKDPQGAQATTENLAMLFRKVLTIADRPTIPLKDELVFVESYLGIEQARLGDRLRVSIDVPEDLESAEVPPLSLQVLVENAVNHGVAPLERGGEVRIGVEHRDGALNLWVEDPGPGFSSHKGTGTALAVLRQRLERLEDLKMGMVEGRHRVSFRWRQA
jgi:hypothetical protein